MGIINKDIIFKSVSRGKWLSQISLLYNANVSIPKANCITLHFSNDIKLEELEPLHLVTLACMIQHFIDLDTKVFLSNNNKEIANYIYNDLGFKHYWADGCNHVDSLTDVNIFNLWRIVETEKELYAKKVESYLKQQFFNGKDLSAISVSLIEAFYNIFDHAQANGNAFSLIKFDPRTNKLHVAISDFGIGITQSIRNRYPEKIIERDSDAIKLSIQDSFTIQSTNHNKGLGFSNILNNVDTARIFSNTGLFVKLKNNQRFLTSTFSFPGTLIYYDLDLSKLDNEEILDTFNW